MWNFFLEVTFLAFLALHTKKELWADGTNPYYSQNQVVFACQVLVRSVATFFFSVKITISVVIF